MHYVTARHPTNDAIALRSSLTVPGITAPVPATVLARVGGQPLVVVSKYGLGRALQWSSYDWMVSTVLAPWVAWTTWSGEESSGQHASPL